MLTSLFEDVGGQVGEAGVGQTQDLQAGEADKVVGLQGS